MVLPFLSLYIDSFGGYTPAEVQRWAGLTFGVSFLVAFLVSPLWVELEIALAGRKY
ncbi:multidrug-efflux transporter [Geomicrobium sp. JCM 19055]|nr:multidrug-efflux transporter [Geomicrobium sp. JCM 19055]